MADRAGEQIAADRRHRTPIAGQRTGTIVILLNKAALAAPYRQIFSINYGIVRYVDRTQYREAISHAPNPICYVYLKDNRYGEDRELRVSLSAIGMGQFALNDGSILSFPPGFRVEFDFGRAIGDGTIMEIIPGPGCDELFLRAEFAKYNIGVAGDPAASPSPA